jgi:hypothetical protein
VDRQSGVAVNLFCRLRSGPIGWQGSHPLAQRANLPFVFDFANARLAITVSVAMNFIFVLLPRARRQRQPDCCAQIRVIFSFLF